MGWSTDRTGADGDEPLLSLLDAHARLTLRVLQSQERVVMARQTLHGSAVAAAECRRTLKTVARRLG